MSDLLETLSRRSLLHQATSEDHLRRHVQGGGRLAYVGFDPTADSLTIGNLVPIMLLRHWQRAGHTPVILMGGGTGLVGDPSGKSAERRLLTLEEVEANVASQRRIFERLLDFSDALQNRARLVNNADWLRPLTFLEVLRDVGKHFSVNAMIQKESVKERLENREQGISYTEFSYMILQAYDFLHLRREMNVTVQMGGSDQWGNIVGGVDLVRRALGKETFGLTAPLVTRSDGGKFGKSEQGAIWLTPERTSPYAFYQFWMNVSDEDAIRYLRIFTLKPIEEIDALAREQNQDPGARQAQRALARNVTAALHGADEAARAEDAARALFSGDVRSLDPRTLEEVFAEVAASEHPKSDLGGEGASLVDLLPETTLADSRRAAREFLQSGAISVNGERVEANRRVTADDLLGAGVILLRRGKKAWHVTRWE